MKTKSRILVVDDELFFRSVLKMPLKTNTTSEKGKMVRTPSLMPGH